MIVIQPDMEPLAITVNGRAREINAAPGAMLLNILRDELGLTGTKEACGRGECGACTVLVGGRSVLSCVTLAAVVTEPVETIEGLVTESLPFREAMADLGGFQCGYCTAGVIVQAMVLLRAGLPADDAVLAKEMAGNLCRCTGYRAILAALRRVDRA
ncbi:carbon-monoxide dehydrogenase small subunit [Salinihabitans flavidus]|uniref:Carbon-monoxide dehydrogenase small subunit n=2 Tax=Salinihabitans flavidus TaxID=569882 RepID=A0A1H8VMM5_9RHOB|nr:carbon-monoxide dehydrogenase small subunit [Salinihabitans flavidus]